MSRGTIGAVIRTLGPIAAVLLTGCGGGTAVPPGALPSLVATPSAGPASHPCATSELQASAGAPVTRGGGTGVVVTLTNAEAGTCALRGYPGAQLSAKGTALLTATAQGGGPVFGNPSAFTVVLHPGQTASVGLEWSAGGGPCRLADSIALLLPGGAVVTVATSLSVCGGPLTVTPVLDSAP